VFDKPAGATRHVTKLQRLRDEYMARQSFAQRIGSGSGAIANQNFWTLDMPKRRKYSVNVHRRRRAAPSTQLLQPHANYKDKELSDPTD
jgi:hypothetical protein